jgi:hypothetical protein
MKTVVYRKDGGKPLEACCILDLSETVRYQAENAPQLEIIIPGLPAVYLKFWRLEFLPGQNVLIGVTDKEGAGVLAAAFPQREARTLAPHQAEFYRALALEAGRRARVTGA